MSVISVYRTFYWVKGRLAGQTGHIWETKEEQARCIKDALGPLPLMSGIMVKPITDIPPTEVQQQQDAWYHIKNQFCLCGIHGYFSPSYCDLMTTTVGKAGFPFPLEPEGTVVYTRVRLGGLVDIHSMGARGEHGLIEEAWCDDDDVGRAVAERYDIPVNQSEFKKEPRTDPLIDNNTKVVRLSPMFSGLNEAVAMTKTGFLPTRLAPGSPPCPCGICNGVGRAPSSLWKCQVCGRYEVYSSNHVGCSGAPPKIVLKPISIDTANSKPGIITRLKRKLKRWGI